MEPRLARRSMELMAEEVMPRVNLALGEEVQKAARGDAKKGEAKK